MEGKKIITPTNDDWWLSCFVVKSWMNEYQVEIEM